ncbi:MAG: NAD(P)-dependent oxidoreductase [Desulfobaccales bacterium]
MKKIVYLGAEVGAQAADQMAAGKAKVWHVPAEPEAVATALKTADAVLDASMKVRITDAMVAAAPRLKIISCATTGADHIARGELERRGIPVRTLQEDRQLLLNLTPAAELSFALLLACARKLPAAFDHVKAGGWTRELFPGVMLYGKRLGIIGCGRIGGWMARYGTAFAMECVGFDPFLEKFPEHIQAVSLEELVQTSDFITVHVPLTPETEGLVSGAHFAMMKPGAIFINTSRGPVADEAALLEALESGRLGAAGLDVLGGEPDIDPLPLVNYARKHDNLIITPHCGGFSPDAVAKVCVRATEKIIDFLKL